MPDEDVMLIAQLSDTHVLGANKTQFLDNNAAAEAIIESLNAERPRPGLVLATGDLTNWGLEQEYETLSRIFAELEIPVLPLVGNHDSRDRTKLAFPETPWVEANHASWVVPYDNLTIIGLDSTSPGVHGGVFDDYRAVWLKDQLQRAPTQVLLAMHHPPFRTGVEWMDASGFAGVEKLCDLIGEFSHQITRVLCGHFHRPVTTTVANVTASVCLAGSFHVELDLRRGAPRSLIRDPRGYQLHRLDGESLVTHTRYVQTGETPFEPDWEE